jgi:hypothetical protein
MKQLFYRIITALLISVAFAHSEETIRFEDYKKLSTEERQKIVNNARGNLYFECLEWDWRLKMGEEGWKHHQEHRLISANGFSELNNLIELQVHIWGIFQTQLEEANRKSGMAHDAQVAAYNALDAEFRAVDKERYKDREWFLVKLAPTPQALALNKRAGQLMVDLEKRFCSTGRWIVTREDIKSIDASIQEIRDEMRKLPQMTPKEEDEAIAKLPPDFPHR